VLRRRVRRMTTGRRDRNRMRSARWRRGRVLLRSRHHRLVYAGRWPLAAIALALCVGVAVVAAVAGPPTIATASALVIAAWTTYALRLQRLVPAGIRGDGPDSPPGAGVREPRRPLPKSPAGAAERPLPSR
jgi:hypothetical protein